jgi:hypothetical protein
LYLAAVAEGILHVLVAVIQVTVVVMVVREDLRTTDLPVGLIHHLLVLAVLVVIQVMVVMVVIMEVMVLAAAVAAVAAVFITIVPLTSAQAVAVAAVLDLLV